MRKDHRVVMHGERPEVTWGYIQTWSGLRVWLDDEKFTNDSITVEDVLVHLPHVNRYTGATDPGREPFSVAQHCLVLAAAVERAGKPRNDIVWALIHDWPEAFISDIPRPFKKAMPKIKALDDRVLAVLAKRYKLSKEMPDYLHVWDQNMCRNEMDAFGNQKLPTDMKWWLVLEPVPGVTAKDLRSRSVLSVRMELRKRVKELGLA